MNEYIDALLEISRLQREAAKRVDEKLRALNTGEKRALNTGEKND